MPDNLFPIEPCIGPHPLDSGFHAFRLWAPYSRKAVLELLSPLQRQVPMEHLPHGYWQAVIKTPAPGTLYRFRLSENTPARPDPASHHQPEGVHGPSALVDHEAFVWNDQGYQPPDISSLVFYEIHIGAFTKKGTFDAAVERLDDLADMGITAVEIMPVAQCPGQRNWGYDGVYLFAAQNSFGGAAGLKTLVDACHTRGMAVFLDVVYNHLGPEGNYLREFGPYFTKRCQTPWGAAINFDGPESDHVRKFFLENARHWFERYHVDGLRLDATHAICDQRPDLFLRGLARTTREVTRTTGKRRFLIAESNLNDPTLVLPEDMGGIGLDAFWNDDFHHSVHALLTGERSGYYQDYGKLEHLAKAIEQGLVYQGEYSHFYRKKHGGSAQGLPGAAFVVCIQNHDQIGNRPHGDRLSQLVCLERLKLAAALMLFSPYLPLLFMGEEYGEETPFLYFIDHSDPHLVDTVRKGRKQDFKAFHWKDQPPDPKSLETFERCKLHWPLRKEGRGKKLLSFYKTCLRLRRELAPLSVLDKNKVRVRLMGSLLLLQRNLDKQEVLVAFNLSQSTVDITTSVPELSLDWNCLLDSTVGKFSISENTANREGELPGYAVRLFYKCLRAP